MQRDALQAEQETNLRLESYNQQLTARNAELKRAQEVAVDACRVPSAPARPRPISCPT